MKYITNRWYKVREAAFLTLLSIELVLCIFGVSTASKNNNLSNFIGALQLFYIPVMVGCLYAVDIIVTGIAKNIKKVCIDAFIGVFFVLSAYAGLEFYMLATGVFLVSSHMASPKNIAKVIAATFFFTTVIVAGMALTGTLEDRLYDRFGRVAHAFGFRWYNFPARQLLFAWLAYMYTRGKNVRWGELIVHLVLIFGVQYYTTSRLTFVVFIMAWVMYVVFVKYELIKINNLFFKLCSLIGFSVCGIGSVLLSYIYNSEIGWMRIIDRAINGRIFLGKEAFRRYDVNLFGQVVKVANDDPSGFFYIDCGYLEVLLKFGVVVFIIVTVIFTVMHFYSVKKNDTMLFVWLTSVMIYTLIDNVWLNPIGAGASVTMFGAVFAQMRKDKLKDKHLTE